MSRASLMRARRAEHQTSAAAAGDFPPGELPEVAFVGRSNVGKSSLINVLTGVSGLARTSSTPGRTRLLNWFRVLPPRGPELAFVDLPGFGYAKVSHAERETWRPLIQSYLDGRAALRAVVLLVDARRGPELDETELAGWLAGQGVVVIPVVTKADKLAKGDRRPAAMAAARALGGKREALLFSARTGDGTEALWRAILDAVTR
jgi:GTP-binding protein